jgi:nucleotide-binding universal stress UspA family protein
MTIRSVLCPLDFSDASRHAIGHAIAIAKQYQARLVGFHACEPAIAAVPAVIGVGTRIDELPEEDVAHVHGRIEAALETARLAGLEVTTDVRRGSAASAIAESAALNDADLIVIGTRGASGLEHLLLGSVTEEVLRRAPCPVLTIPRRAADAPELPFRRILCPTDFSASSALALDLALALAAEERAGVTLLHVIDDPDENELFVPRPYDVHHHAEAREARVHASLMQLVPPRLRDRVVVRIVHGDPADEILRAAGVADLVVMGVHGRKPLEAVVFGSTTDHVVRRALCPVLTPPADVLAVRRESRATVGSAEQLTFS